MTREIFRLHKGIILSIGLMLIVIDSAAQTNTFTGTGNWSSTSNWSMGAIPVSGQSVVIASGATCTVNATITIPASGTINSLTVTGTLQTEANTTMNVGTGGISITGIFYLNNETGSTATTVNDAGGLTITGGDLDFNHNTSSSGAGTTFNVSGNFLSNAAINNNNGSQAGGLNFNGSNVVQTWNCSSSLADHMEFNINGTNNSLKLISNENNSGTKKTILTVSSGDTLDLQTFTITGGNGTNAVPGTAGEGITINSGGALKSANTTGLSASNIIGEAGVSLSTGGIYIYSGTANQVTGTLLPTAISGSLIMHNTGSSITPANEVTLSQATSVSGTLNFLDGILLTTATNVLTYTGAATNSGGDSLSFVDGPMKKTGTTTYKFPLGGLNGTKERFMPLGITAPAISTTITAQYFYAVPTNPTNLMLPLTKVSSNEYWIISETTSTPVFITLYWADGNNAGINSGIYNYTTDLRVAEYDIWEDLGSNGTSGGPFPKPGSVTATTSITGFSNLPVTFGTEGDNPLPITLVSFTANYEETLNSVLVNWTAETQLNNKEYIIQKSLNGVNYTNIDTVAGDGTYPFPKSYSILDHNPALGISYYRLRQVDIDETPTDYVPAAVFIENGRQQNVTANIYPNPTTANNANLVYTAQNTQAINVSIIDVNGKTVYTSFFDRIQIGENVLELNIAALSKGIYFIHFTNSEESYNIRFLKL